MIRFIIFIFILFSCSPSNFKNQNLEKSNDRNYKSLSEPETTAPETTAPETTAPETTAPETTAPETTAPETTAPETTAPETTAPETTAPETTAPETTAPETTAPETTAPETTAPDQERDCDRTRRYEGSRGACGYVGDDPRIIQSNIIGAWKYEKEMLEIFKINDEMGLIWRSTLENISFVRNFNLNYLTDKSFTLTDRSTKENLLCMYLIVKDEMKIYCDTIGRVKYEMVLDSEKKYLKQDGY